PLVPGSSEQQLKGYSPTWPCWSTLVHMCQPFVQHLSNICPTFVQHWSRVGGCFVQVGVKAELVAHVLPLVPGSSEEQLKGYFPTWPRWSTLVHMCQPFVQHWCPTCSTLVPHSSLVRSCFVQVGVKAELVAHVLPLVPGSS